MTGPTQISITAYNMKNGLKNDEVLTIKAGTAKFSSVDVAMNENFLLECRIPIYVREENFNWYENGEMVNGSRKNIVHDDETRDGLVMVKSLQFISITKENGNVYKCENHKKSVELSMLMKIIESQKPQITSKSNFYSTGIVNDYFAFKLNVKGIPKPILKVWRDNKTLDLDVDDTDRIFWGDDGHSLVFKNLDFDDTGVYTFIAINTAGEDVIELKLEVKMGKLKLKLRPKDC